MKKGKKNRSKVLQLPYVACIYNFINLSMCIYNFNVAVRNSINLYLSIPQTILQKLIT